MAIDSGSDRMMSDINVTPFVDVMLVLLIIFMVTAPMMTQGVDVTLPQATSDPLPSKEEQVVVTLDNSGIIHINDALVPRAELADSLSRVMRGRKDQPVFLRADQDLPYGEVMAVMSEIQAAGIQRLGMVTVPLRTPEEGVGAGG